MSACTEKCWTPATCPQHDEPMYPIGRDAGMDAYPCCENYQRPNVNPRHLWDEHDSTRWYTDPDGWNEHERTCEKCRPEVEPTDD